MDGSPGEQGPMGPIGPPGPPGFPGSMGAKVGDSKPGNGYMYKKLLKTLTNMINVDIFQSLKKFCTVGRSL